MKKFISFLMLSAILSFSLANAHGGGLNKKGCHNDNSPGGVYHCH